MANTWNNRLATFTLAYFLAGYACARIPENDYLMIIIGPLVLFFSIIDIYQIYLIFSKKGKPNPTKSSHHHSPIKNIDWEDLKSKLGEGDQSVEEVLDLLSRETIGTKFRNEFIMLKGHWYSLIEESSSKVTSYEQTKMEKNRIRKHLLNMIDRMKNDC